MVWGKSREERRGLLKKQATQCVQENTGAQDGGLEESAKKPL
jgi:hypothetical protein